MNRPIVKLGELATFLNGGTPTKSYPQFFCGDIPWITGADINGSVVRTARSYITEEAVMRSATNRVPKGTVLLVTRTSVGKVAKAGVDLCFSQDITAVRQDESRLDASYLVHFLRTKQGYFERIARGATIKGVTREVLTDLRVPIPPLDEQRRIAAILDKAEELRAKRRAAIALLDQLPQAIFLEMFGDPVANPMGWPNSKCLAEVADLVSGITKGRKVNEKPLRAVPYLAVANVQDRHLALQTVKTIEATEDEIARYRLVPNDLLLTEGGDPDKLGRGSLWNSELPEAIHQNHIFRVRVKSREVTPLFLSWLIGSRYGKAYFLRQAKQTTGIATINMGQLRAFPLLLPPVALQETFAAHVETVHCAQSAHHSAITELDALFASLQAIAFSGRLSDAKELSHA